MGDGACDGGGLIHLYAFTIMVWFEIKRWLLKNASLDVSVTREVMYADVAGTRRGKSVEACLSLEKSPREPWERESPREESEKKKMQNLS